MRGAFIVLEGIDGAGTTTQADRLRRHFEARGRPCVVTGEPSRGPIGLELRKILRGAYAPVDAAAVALLFAADRIDHLRREIDPALESGTHVLCDRYLLSSLAYQTTTLATHGVPEAREFVLRINALARLPDLTLVLDLPVAVAAKRRQQRGQPEELFDARALQERVASAYRDEVARAQRAGDPLLLVDGTPPPDAVFAVLADAAESCVARLGAAR